MRFQYVSDLHTEIRGGGALALSARAPCLLLAGDLGHPRHPAYARLLDEVASDFERIILVAGNHEYYGATVAAGETALVQAAAGRPRVTYLQNQAFHFPDSDVSVFGGTFWTYIPPAERAACNLHMADYERIHGFTPEMSSQLHAAAVSALGAALEEAPERRWVVVSHHIPKRCTYASSSLIKLRLIRALLIVALLQRAVARSGYVFHDHRSHVGRRVREQHADHVG